jgi:hypothetical protein
MGTDFTFFSSGEMEGFADLVESAMSTTITLEEVVGSGDPADYVTRGQGIPARKQRLRTNILETTTAGPAGLGSRVSASYITQTPLPVESGWRLTDESTGERYRVLGNLTDAGWPYVQLRCEAWN